jgi:hypothetical protein
MANQDKEVFITLNKEGIIFGVNQVPYKDIDSVIISEQDNTIHGKYHNTTYFLKLNVGGSPMVLASSLNGNVIKTLDQRVRSYLGTMGYKFG